MSVISSDQLTLEQVFQKLTEVLEERSARGLSPRSAGVKSVLTAKLGGAFDEKVFGFGTFRRFLEEAERRGLVSMTPAEVGPDVDVTLPALSRRELQPSTPAGGARVRSDLWRAFVHWESGKRRFWDPIRKTIVERDAREIERYGVHGLVAIHAISADDTKAWMSDFAESERGAVRSALLDSLRDSNPFRRFREVTDELQRTREWRRYMQVKVTGAITAWATENSLDVDIYEARSPGEPRSAPSAVSAPDEESTRRIVLDYVGRMTLPELLAIPVPVRLLRR